MSSDVTVILNGYRRKDALDIQLQQLEKQSIKPDDIMLWYNYPGDPMLINMNAVHKTRSVVSNTNFGVWGRFTYALNAKTKYVCIFDDDTIPGTKWIENCLTTIKEKRGVLGTIGLHCNDRDEYFNHTRYGWDNPNEDTVEVDLVGHSWFFEREWLSAMFREVPNPEYDLCGEDMHLSYAVQKYLGLKTFVPPHPKNDKEMWGSLMGWELGVDENAISHLHTFHGKDDFRKKVNTYFKGLLNNGWTLVNDK
tara:strand:+ start:314 stop:1066 length:753 start_codon:yes stop_codon:yes gene_type:complete